MFFNRWWLLWKTAVMTWRPLIAGTISIVREDVLSAELREQIVTVHGQLRTATGEKELIHRVCKLQQGIRCRELPQTLWLARIHDQCILGLDFLQSHDCQVNLKEGNLTTDGEETFLRGSTATQEQSCCRVVLSKGVRIPRLSESVIEVKVDGQRWGLLE